MLQIMQNSPRNTDINSKENQENVSEPGFAEDEALDLFNTAHQLMQEFKVAVDISSLDTVILLLECASYGWPPADVGYRKCLHLLAKSLLIRFIFTTNDNDVASAVQIRCGAVFGSTFPVQHLFKEHVRDAYNAEDDVEEILATAEVILNDLLKAWSTNALDTIILLYQEAVKAPQTHSRRVQILWELPEALLIKFYVDGESACADEAVTLLREVQKIKVNRSIGVCAALIARYDEPEGGSRLLEARNLCLEMGRNHNRGRELAMTGQDFLRLFQTNHDPQHLEAAVRTWREAESMLIWGNEDRTTIQINLASALQLLFRNNGDSMVLDEVIEMGRELVELDSTPEQRDVILNTLANVIQARYDQCGDSNDMNEAIKLHRDTSLNNLANVLQTRWQATGDHNDITEAIKLYREALDLCDPQDPERGMYLNNFASAILRRQDSHEDSDLVKIEQTIELFREILQLCPPPHPYHYGALNNLGVALRSRFKQKRDPKDIDEAIEKYRKVLELRPSPHSGRDMYLINLAETLQMRLTSQADPHDLEEAITLCREAAVYPTSTPLSRFSASKQWAEIAFKNGHSSQLDAYRASINLLPELAAFDLDIKSRQDMLTRAEITSLASSAAACAVDLGHNNLAVEFLEASRSIFWAQALQLRTPVGHLMEVEPQLANQLKQISHQLEEVAFRNTSRTIPNFTQAQLMSIENEGVRSRRLNKEWTETVEEVRKLPGFADFLRPKSMASLREAAASGPIVVLLAGKSTGTALIVTSSEDVQCVQLPEMHLLMAEAYAIQMRELSMQGTIEIGNFNASTNKSANAPSWFNVNSRLYGGRERTGTGTVTSDLVLQVLLKFLWTDVVKLVLDALNLKKSNKPPRLCWCPTGPFAFLPVHAAGLHYDDPSECVSHYVISSYTPTLTALLNRPSSTESTYQFKMTIVIDPNAPNCAPLPGTGEELARIMDHVPANWLTTLLSPTGHQALAHLRQSSVVHLACHGIQDHHNPLDSGLELSTGRLKVSEIMRRKDSSVEEVLRGSSLAFLSACETAKGDSRTPDEAMHLAATLLFAGFHSIVATMWTMEDQDGPKVADAFYEYLFKNCDSSCDPPVLPDPAKTAEALHFAVEKLRKEPGVSFRRWVPFVHYGM
ncbi:CHAT domain-containing protein [Mycena leptocephala]|nr:CHAT domain-containing protein [Mycena leptocephala]